MAWQNVPAQPRAIRFLRQMVLRQRVSHALLLTGMAGIGKSALAKEFAKLVNCRDPQDGNCCDACDACRKIDGGMHPDVITLAPEGQFFKVEQIRGLQGQLRFRPFEGRMRVIIIQDGHLLLEGSDCPPSETSNERKRQRRKRKPRPSATDENT